MSDSCSGRNRSCALESNIRQTKTLFREFVLLLSLLPTSYIYVKKVGSDSPISVYMQHIDCMGTAMSPRFCVKNAYGRTSLSTVITHILLGSIANDAKNILQEQHENFLLMLHHVY